MQIKTNSVLPSEVIHKFRKSGNMGPEQETNVSMCEELRQFGEKSTIHGLRHVIGISSSGCRNLGLLVYQIMDRVQFFYSYPKTVNVQLIQNQSLPFPSVTICNQNMFKATWALKAGKYQMIKDMFSRQMNSKAADLKNYSPENISLEDLYVQGAHKKEDFILNATWIDTSLTTNDIDLVFTDHGVCYTFRGNELGRVSSPGVERGLHVTLNIEQYEYMYGHNDAAGLKLLIHDHQEIPRVRVLGQAIPPGSSVLVGVKLKETEDLPPPRGTCAEKQLYYLEGYTPENCRVDCLTKKTEKVCGCRAPFMPKKNEDPPVCKLHQYGCLKTVIDTFSNLNSFCNCPVSCRSRVFETDLSFGSLSKYSRKQFMSLRDNTKIETDLLEASETSSKFKNSKLSEMKHFYSRLTNDTETISSFYDKLVNVMNNLIMGSYSLYKDIIERYTFKEFLYRFQIHIMEENFMKARDEMEETHVHYVAFEYTEYIALVEKSIRTLANPKFKDNSSRLCIYQSVTNKIDSKIETLESIMVNYTSLKNAYSQGKKLYNIKFTNTPRNHIDPAIPTKLISESLKHNSNAKRSTIRFKKLLKGAVKALKLCKRLTDISFRSGIIEETEVLACIEDFRYSIRTWLKIRTLFYYEVVDRPVRVLHKSLDNFNIVWNTSQQLFQNINETLQSMRLEDVDFKIRIFNPIRKLNLDLERYFSNNTTKLNLSNEFLSQNTNYVLIEFRTYFQNLQTRNLPLKNRFLQLQSSLLDVWEVIIDDEDSLEYYKFLNKTEYLVSITEAEIELEEKFHSLLDIVEFTGCKTGFSSDLQLLNTVNAIINHMTEYQDSLKLDDDFVRDNILQIDIFYSDMSYARMVHQSAYDIFSLMCDVGGAMSLFLGASILSVLDVVDFVLIRIITRVTTRMRAKRS